MSKSVQSTQSTPPKPRVTVTRRLGLRLFGPILLVAALAGCTSLPDKVARQPSKSLGAAAETPLGRIAKASTADPEQSGFRLMPTGQFALQARIELARRAQRTLDVQYYQIHDDRTGRYLLRTLRDASQRGVRVRLIIDDLYTSGQDPLLLGLDAYPNVEVRLFNPFPAGRQNFLTRFTVNCARLRPRAPAHAQQAVHRRRRDGRGRRAQHRRRILHGQRRRELRRPGHLRHRRDPAAPGCVVRRILEQRPCAAGSRHRQVRSLRRAAAAGLRTHDPGRGGADPARHRNARRARRGRGGRGHRRDRRHARTRGAAAERRARLRPDRQTNSTPARWG